MLLETVAAVPGMVGGMLLHCKSLRRFEDSGGWIKALLEEAENERMHLMTFLEVVKPKWYERALVFVVQGGWFNLYFLLYVINPKIAHRMVGYLEEEAVYSYTQYLKAIDEGSVPNGPAPAIAIDYWRLPKDATIRDVVNVVRADETHHRDVNHFASVSQNLIPLHFSSCNRILNLSYFASQHVAYIISIHRSSCISVAHERNATCTSDVLSNHNTYRSFCLKFTTSVLIVRDLRLEFLCTNAGYFKTRKTVAGGTRTPRLSLKLHLVQLVTCIDTLLLHKHQSISTTKGLY